MTCKSCSEKKRATTTPRKITQDSTYVSEAILSARHAICLNCQHHKMGECEILHGQDLATYATRPGAMCPHPERKW